MPRGVLLASAGAEPTLVLPLLHGRRTWAGRDGQEPQHKAGPDAANFHAPGVSACNLCWPRLRTPLLHRAAPAHRVLLPGVAYRGAFSVLLAYCGCMLFIRIKMPGYLRT